MFLIWCCLAWVAPSVWSQQAAPSVTGKVIESSSTLPMEFVNIILRDARDSSIIQSTVTDSIGGFVLQDAPMGTYFLEANLLGFEPGYTPAFSVVDPAKELNVGTISLTASDVLLQPAEITANFQPLATEIDRKIYYPEDDIQSQSGSAADILQNIPSITVDPEGEITLRGSGNITFLLNGRPSGLLTSNSALVLEQIPAHTIERIEIITNPSARYKPDGTAGIINIITKKNALPGFNGSVLGNVSSQNRYNGNLALTYNPGKWNFTSSYGYRQNFSPRAYEDFRIIPDKSTGTERTYEENGTSESQFISHSASLGVDFHPDEMNQFGIDGSWFSFNSDRDIHSTILEQDPSGIINHYMTPRTESDKEWEMELTAFAEHNFKKEDHTIAVEASYDMYDELEDGYFNDIYFVPEYPEYRGHSLIDKVGHTTHLSADYTNPLPDDSELELGYEGEISSGDFNYGYEYFDFADEDWMNDVTKTNRFRYHHDIHALYSTWAKSFDRLGILAGLRAEQTNILSDLVTLDSIIPNDYFNIYPSLHLSFRIGEDHEAGLSYSHRVNRPDADELNPFPEYTDIRDIEAGNPNLKPEHIHSIELGFQLSAEKLTLNPTLYYRHTYDAFTEVSEYINDSTLLTTTENLSTETSGGLEVIVSWIPTRKLSFNFNTNIYHNTIDASNLGYEGNKSAISSDSKLAAFIDVTPTTRLQFNGTYRSSMLSAQGESLPVYFLNAGFKQDIFRNKASITLTVSDIFNTMKWQTIIDTDELYQKVTRKRKSQIIYLGFSYRFGLDSKKSEDDE